MALGGTICPYSLYSCQFFLLFPLTKLGQYFGLPTLLGYIVALGAPAFLLDTLVKLLAKTNHVTLVEHSPNVAANHSHSSAITLQVILHSVILGIMLSVGMTLIQSSQLEQHFVPLGFYMILLAFFHFSEYFVTSLTNPSTLTVSSFLIDQSYAYVIAILCSFTEYTLEAYLFPDFKKFNVISLTGLIVAICSEFVRKLAMFTAGKNFSHSISVAKAPDHQLVTHGICDYMRHPSYAGWFYWAIATQVLLLNPICVILFSVISYKFFKDRIEYEERILIDFFEEDYRNYKKRVRLWMPISI